MLKNKAFLAIFLAFLGLSFATSAQADVISSQVTGSPAYVTNHDPFRIDFVASPDGDVLSGVDLYVSSNGGASWDHVDTPADTSFDTSTGIGWFDFAPGVDGTYDFYTIASDPDSNVEIKDPTIESETVVDTAAPVAETHAPATSDNVTFQVPVTITETGSGVDTITAFVRKDGDAWTMFSPNLLGPVDAQYFEFTPTGDGTYDFYMIATDNAGNAEADTQTAESTTVVSTPAPAEDTPPASGGNSGGGSSSSGGGSGFIGSNLPPTGQVLGAFTTNNTELANLFAKLLLALKNKSQVKPTIQVQGKVLGAFTAPISDILQQVVNRLNNTH